MSNASSTSTGKRKRTTPTSFYAVKVGRTPGIYQTWNETRQQIDGFPNPVCKWTISVGAWNHIDIVLVRKFSTYTEAEAMVKGSSTSGSKSGKTKFYGVAVGHVPGVYTDYASVQAQTKGCMGAKQKGFATRAEAQAYVEEHNRYSNTPISLRGDLSETFSQAEGTASKANLPNKRQKKENQAPGSTLPNGNVEYELGTGPLPPDTEDGFDRTIKLDTAGGYIRRKTEEELGASKSQPTGDFSGPVVVYTDGSSLGNGRVGAVGGVGVYFGRNDPR